MNDLEQLQSSVGDQTILQSLLDLRTKLKEQSTHHRSSFTDNNIFAVTLEELKNQQDPNCADILQQLQDIMTQRDVEIGELLDKIQDIKAQFHDRLTDLVSEYVMLKKLGA